MSWRERVRERIRRSGSFTDGMVDLRDRGRGPTRRRGAGAPAGPRPAAGRVRARDRALRRAPTGAEVSAPSADRRDHAASVRRRGRPPRAALDRRRQRGDATRAPSGSGSRFEGVLRSFMPEPDGPHDYAMYAHHEERSRRTDHRMDLNKLTMKSQAALQEAQQQAAARHHQSIEPEHVLVRAARRRRGGRVPAAAPRRARTRRSCARGSTRRSRRCRRCTPRAVERARLAGDRPRCWRRAGTEAEALTDEYISTEHLLLAMLAAHGRRPACCSTPGSRATPSLAALAEVRGRQRVTSANPEDTFQSLEKYGRDLTESRAQRQARPGDRARRGDPAHDPGAVAAHEEQPGADRRARRRQDRHRRGARAAHRRRRRADVAAGQAPDRARPRRDGRRREVPGRVRGATQGRAEGDRRQRGRGHHVHRRAAHDRRRGCGRGRHGRRQHAEADARAR